MDNADGDQGEKYDQYLCLADGPLKDDIIWQLLTKAWSDVPGLRICPLLRYLQQSYDVPWGALRLCRRCTVPHGYS